GDANLDGNVNALDFNSLASNFGLLGRFWFHGDFNYDGTVNTIDFTVLATNFAKTVPAPAEPLQSVVQSARVAANPAPSRIPWADQPAGPSWTGWSDWSASAIQEEITAAGKDLFSSSRVI